MSFGEILMILIVLAFFAGAAVMGMARPWDDADPSEHPERVDPDADATPGDNPLD